MQVIDNFKWYDWFADIQELCTSTQTHLYFLIQHAGICLLNTPHDASQATLVFLFCLFDCHHERTIVLPQLGITHSNQLDKLTVIVKLKLALLAEVIKQFTRRPPPLQNRHLVNNVGNFQTECVQWRVWIVQHWTTEQYTLYQYQWL